MSVYKTTIEVINNENYITYELFTIEIISLQNFIIKEIEIKKGTFLLYSIYEIENNNENLIFHKSFTNNEKYFCFDMEYYPYELKNKNYQKIDLIYNDKYYKLNTEYCQKLLE